MYCTLYSGWMLRPIRGLPLLTTVAVWIVSLSSPNCSTAADLFLTNTSDYSVVFLYRPASQRAAGPEAFSSINVPSGSANPVRVRLTAGDPYDVQVRNTTRAGVESVSSFIGNVVNLEDIAVRQSGTPLDLRLSMAARRLPSGELVGHVAAAQLTSAGIQQSLNSSSDRIKALLRSSWDTTFVTQEGARVGARIDFNAEGNRYATSDFAGTLERVFIVQTADGANIQGIWRGAGSSGLFVFTITGDRVDNLDGKWKFSGSDEWFTWEGSRRE